PLAMYPLDGRGRPTGFSMSWYQTTQADMKDLYALSMSRPSRLLRLSSENDPRTRAVRRFSFFASFWPAQGWGSKLQYECGAADDELFERLTIWLHGPRDNPDAPATLILPLTQFQAGRQYAQVHYSCRIDVPDSPGFLMKRGMSMYKAGQLPLALVS